MEMERDGGPRVRATFTVAGAAPASLSVRVNGGAAQAVSRAEASSGITLPFGAIVEVAEPKRMLVADPAFDWNARVPLRAADSALSGSLEVALAL